MLPKRYHARRDRTIGDFANQREIARENAIRSPRILNRFFSALELCLIGFLVSRKQRDRNALNLSSSLEGASIQVAGRGIAPSEGEFEMRFSAVGAGSVRCSQAESSKEVS